MVMDSPAPGFDEWLAKLKAAAEIGDVFKVKKVSPGRTVGINKLATGRQMFSYLMEDPE